MPVIEDKVSNYTKESIGTKSSPIYERHISYKTSETKNQNLSDFRSKYLGIKTSNAQELSDRASLVQAALDAQNDQSPAKVKYIGPCLGTFLLAEKNNCLYIIDQHAVHERILFDQLMNNQGQTSRQALLIPYKIHTESKSQDNQLEKLKEQLGKIGFETKKVSDGEWEVTSIPDRWTGTEYDFRTLIFVKHVEPQEIIRSIAAMTACKAAVKDGYILDDQAATKLVEAAFTLEDPHCPHGRPIYTVISREKLFELVKRT